MNAGTKIRSSTKGSALLEFAIVLPLLVVFIVGIYDFSGALNQKQKISHAAQEAAIVAGAQPMTDMDPSLSNTNPESLQPVLEVIFNSLSASRVLPPGSLSGCVVTPGHTTSDLHWTYSISGCSPYPLLIEIDRGVVFIDPTASSLQTKVKVSYPYHWRFNSVIQLVVPGAAYAQDTPLSATATVHNQM